MSKHTPGPWTLGKGSITVRTDDGTKICECYTTKHAISYPQIDERMANANLIASAPDLFAAAIKAMDECVDLIETDAGRALLSAIAKARGEK